MTFAARRPLLSLIWAAAILARTPAAIAADTPAVIDAKTFGAICDGVTDDTAALRKAAAAVPPGGAELRFPKGVCVIHKTIFVKLRTRAVGTGGTLMAARPFVAEHPHGYALIENEHFDATRITDSDISVSGMNFDYGAMGPQGVPGGGKHAVRFQYARDIVVQNNVFQLRGAEDAVAGIGVQAMTVQGNKAYEFHNCAYDFWGGPADVRLLDNYAETTHSAQMVNFNPEWGSPERNQGMVAHGFEMSGNTLVVTGPKAAPMLLSPLGKLNTVVRDVTVENNTLRNVYIVMRGNVQHATVRGNIFDHVAGGPGAFEAYPFHAFTPTGISFTGNRVIAPATEAKDGAVIRMQADNFVLTGNSITGAGAARAAPIEHGGYRGTEQGNTITH
jgi:hypothetical protein